MWTLNTKIIEKIKEYHEENADEEISRYTNKFLKKVTNNLENFSYNKIVANLHEMHSFFTIQINKNYKKDTLLKNYQKILVAMQPVIPHFSNECLELINVFDVKWPKYDEKMIQEEKINLVIQINGKKRNLIEIEPDKPEEELFEIIQKDEKIIKYIQNLSLIHI